MNRFYRPSIDRTTQYIYGDLCPGVVDDAATFLSG